MAGIIWWHRTALPLVRDQGVAPLEGTPGNHRVTADANRVGRRIKGIPDTLVGGIEAHAAHRAIERNPRRYTLGDTELHSQPYSIQYFRREDIIIRTPKAIPIGLHRCCSFVSHKYSKLSPLVPAPLVGIGP